MSVLEIRGLVVVASRSLSDDEEATTPTTSSAAAQPVPTQVSITAKDYAFDVPASFKGGLGRFSYANTGREPHFAAFAKVPPGKTFADVRSTLTSPPSAAPPSGPPPFEDVASLSTTDPGATGNMTLNLPRGTYALYCPIPSPDGTPHVAKGMINEVTVTEGADGELPPSVGTIKAVDFELAPLPPVKAGNNVFRLSNQGKQIHEINLVELPPGKTVDDVVAWYREQKGPPPMPPMLSLSGVAIKPGDEATTELNLKAGSRYAFVCAIPDFLGDFKPHVTKGMHTKDFTVS